MSWFWSSSSSSSNDTNNKETEKQPVKEPEQQTEQPKLDDVARLLKFDLSVTEHSSKELKDARLPVIRRIQAESERWKNGDSVWFLRGEDCIVAGVKNNMFIARKKTINDTHRFSKNGIQQMAILLNHKLNVFYDFKCGWSEDGEFRDSGILFPVMNNDREIIRALIYPFIVVFDSQ